nr:TPA_asm: putative glycoprotein [Sclerotinia sclerotiorum negative-stranded RNA virus 5]
MNFFKTAMGVLLLLNILIVDSHKLDPGSYRIGCQQYYTGRMIADNVFQTSKPVNANCHPRPAQQFLTSECSKVTAFDNELWSGILNCPPLRECDTKVPIKTQMWIDEEGTAFTEVVDAGFEDKWQWSCGSAECARDTTKCYGDASFLDSFSPEVGPVDSPNWCVRNIKGFRSDSIGKPFITKTGGFKLYNVTLNKCVTAFRFFKHGINMQLFENTQIETCDDTICDNTILDRGNHTFLKSDLFPNKDISFTLRGLSTGQEQKFKANLYEDNPCMIHDAHHECIRHKKSRNGVAYGVAFGFLISLLMIPTFLFCCKPLIRCFARRSKHPEVKDGKKDHQSESIELIESPYKATSTAFDKPKNTISWRLPSLKDAAKTAVITSLAKETGASMLVWDKSCSEMSCFSTFNPMVSPIDMINIVAPGKDRQDMIQLIDLNFKAVTKEIYQTFSYTVEAESEKFLQGDNKNCSDVAQKSMFRTSVDWDYVNTKEINDLSLSYMLSKSPGGDCPLLYWCCRAVSAHIKPLNTYTVLSIEDWIPQIRIRYRVDGEWDDRWITTLKPVKLFDKYTITAVISQYEEPEKIKVVASMDNRNRIQEVYTAKDIALQGSPREGVVGDIQCNGDDRNWNKCDFFSSNLPCYHSSAFSKISCHFNSPDLRQQLTVLGAVEGARYFKESNDILAKWYNKPAMFQLMLVANHTIDPRIRSTDCEVMRASMTGCYDCEESANIEMKMDKQVCRGIISTPWGDVPVETTDSIIRVEMLIPSKFDRPKCSYVDSSAKEFVINGTLVHNKANFIGLLHKSYLNNNQYMIDEENNTSWGFNMMHFGWTSFGSFFGMSSTWLLVVIVLLCRRP